MGNIINKVLNIALPLLFSAFSLNTLRAQPKSTKMEIEDKIEIQIVSLQVDPTEKDKCILSFHAVNDSIKVLSMQIGMSEAQVLTIALENMKPIAPLPLDLLQSAIIQFGYTIKEVIIDDQTNGIYISNVICISNSKTIILNARPVDTSILAYKFECPIYTYKKLLSKSWKNKRKRQETNRN